MNKVALAEMKQDRLVNTAIVAFLGSLLMGQGGCGKARSALQSNSSSLFQTIRG